MKISVNSEIGKLKKVLVHRPGREVERMYPAILKELLFDDVLYLEQAQKEHDFFVKKLTEEGVEVYYIERLLADVFDADPTLRARFISQFIKQAGVTNQSVIKACELYFGAIKNNYELVKATIAGIKKTEVTPQFQNSLVDQVNSTDEYPFYINPIPNILFQRDPLIAIYNNIKINRMWSRTRKREAIYIKYVLDYHPLLKLNNVLDNSQDLFGSLEGGDVLVIKKTVMLVGLSQRTDANGIQNLADNLFEKNLRLKRIIVVKISATHSTMHLDTILTQMDCNRFLVAYEMLSLSYKCFAMTRSQTVAFDAKIFDLLQKYVAKNVAIIPVGGGETIRAKREQWNDGANCLCIRPGVVMTYRRNKITNQMMRDSGIKVIEIPGSELSRGRGGPRCMTMPLERDEVAE